MRRWVCFFMCLLLCSCSAEDMPTELTDSYVVETVELPNGTLHFEPFVLGGAYMPWQPQRDWEQVTLTYEDIVADTGFDLAAATAHLPEKMQLGKARWTEQYWRVTEDCVFAEDAEWGGAPLTKGTIWGGYVAQGNGEGNGELQNALWIGVQREGELINHPNALYFVESTGSWLPAETSNIGEAKVGICAQDGYETGIFAENPLPIDDSYCASVTLNGWTCLIYAQHYCTQSELVDLMLAICDAMNAISH